MKNEKELNDELISLKKIHKDVYQVEVFLDDTETNIANIFLKHPDRTIYSQVAKFLGDGIRAVEVFVKGTYIGGDDINTIMSNDYALRSLDTAIANIMYVKQSTLKKK